MNRTVPGLLLIAIALAGASLAEAAPAGAATTRYASPTGTNLDDCTVGDPCDIPTALSQSGGVGDDVQLVGGVPPAPPFVVSVPFLVPADTAVHGAPGARPVISVSSPVQASEPGSMIRDAVIESASTPAAGVVEVSNGGLLERVTVKSSGGQHACFALAGGSIRDSICWHQGSDFASALRIERNVDAGSTSPVTLHGVTVVTAAPGTAPGLSANVASPTVGLVVNATNTIADGPNGGDVVAARSGGNATVAVNLDHSDYSTAFASPDPAATVTPPGTMNGQTVPPEFADAAAGDFRQATTSNGTLDRGTATGLLPNELDFEGQARISGAAPDIGADEFPAISTTGSPAVTPAAVPKRCRKGRKLRKGKCVKKKRKKRKG